MIPKAVQLEMKSMLGPMSQCFRGYSSKGSSESQKSKAVLSRVGVVAGLVLGGSIYGGYARKSYCYDELEASAAGAGATIHGKPHTKIQEIDELDRKIQTLANAFFATSPSPEVEELVKTLEALGKSVEFNPKDPINKKDNLAILDRVEEIYSKSVPFNDINLPMINKPLSILHDRLEKESLILSSLIQDPDVEFNLEVKGKVLLFRGAGLDNVGKLIGTGRSGRVFFGKDPDTGNEIAVKVTKSPDEGNLLIEMQGSVYVVEALATESARGVSFIVMEKIPGVDLEQRTYGLSRLNLKETIHILREVAIGVKELHSKGIVHGDLHPENVLINKKTGKPKIIDLGNSRKIENNKNLAHNGFQMKYETDIGSLIFLINLAILGGTTTRIIKAQPQLDLNLSMNENFYYSFPLEMSSNEDCLLPVLLSNEKIAKRLGTLVTSKEISIEKMIQELEELEIMIEDSEGPWDKVQYHFSKLIEKAKELLGA